MFFKRNEDQYHLAPVDLLATSTTLVVPVQARLWVPKRVLLHVGTLTGTLTAPPIVRLGNNGNHDNLCPLFTLTGAVLNQVFDVTLATPRLAIDVTTTGISFEVQTAGTATTMTGQVRVYGDLV